MPTPTDPTLRAVREIDSRDEVRLAAGLRIAFSFSRRAITRAALLGTLAAGAEAVLAVSLGAFAQRIASGAEVGWAVGAIASGAAARIMVQVAIGHVAAVASIDAQHELRRIGLDAVLRADAEGHEPATDALSRWLERVPRAAQARQASVAIAAQSVQVVVLGALVVHAAPALGAAMIAVLLLTGVIATTIARRVRAAADQLAPSQRRVVGIVERATRHVLEIRALGTADLERARLAAAVDDHAALQRRLARGNALASASPLLPGVIAIGVLAALGVRTGLPAATLIAMLYVLVRLSGSLAAAGHALGVLAAAGPSLAALDSERRARTPRAHAPSPSSTTPCAITIDGATLTLGGRVVLSRVQVAIEAGEVVAIIGPSGSGKTTLLRAVLGLIAPNEGRVRIDGSDAATWAARARLGLVTAEPFLFAGTLRENLSYGAASALDDEMLRAALARVSAGALAAGPEGLARRVGEGGEGLSFGERQRVALARALAPNPALLVLDEPTSGLEPSLEQEIAALLHGLRGQCTVLVATHRAPLIEACDRALEIAPADGGGTVSSARDTRTTSDQVSP